MDNRFRWTERLHGRADFRRIFKEGRRFTGSGLALWVVRRPLASPGHPRLGLAIPRTYGSAVQRNRLKRLLREVFRLNKASLSPDIDIVFSARRLSVDISLKGVGAAVLELWKRAGVLKGTA